MGGGVKKGELERLFKIHILKGGGGEYLGQIHRYFGQI